jgi:protein-tyrosine phosphatase
MRILFVCTGNLCRSPVAERLAMAWARDLLKQSPEHAGIEIGSAGIDGVPGRQMDARSADALRALGGDPAGFRSRSLEARMADEADLVITMSRRQRREVLEKSPRGLRRTFTLLEAAELLQRADLTGLNLLPLALRARELGLRLDAARSYRPTRASDDVIDPIGRSASVHREMAASIAAALRPLAAVLFSSIRPQSAVPAEGTAPDRDRDLAISGRDSA